MLDPTGAVEAILAVQYLIVTEHVCLALRTDPKPPTEKLAIGGRRVLKQLVREAERTRSELLAAQVAPHKREAASGARQVTAQPGPTQGTGGGLVAGGEVAAAPALLPPSPRRDALPAPPRRAPPVPRLIRGGPAD